MLVNPESRPQPSEWAPQKPSIRAENANSSTISARTTTAETLSVCSS